ncbi:MAG: phosphatase PAP2 family protein [Thermoleophilia bacterium]|nr:phosphatase PAP2 family protein [Thermoleophilia bacterium]
MLSKLARSGRRIDRALLVLLRTRGHGPLAVAVARGLSAFGERGIGWAGLGLAAAAADRRRRGRLLAAAAAAPAALGLNSVVKAASGRERPVVAGHAPLASATSRLSFPSAHAATSVAAAVSLGRVAPGARPALYGLAGLICAGRPYLGMHYPSDVLAGAALGLVVGHAWPLPDPRRVALAATAGAAPSPPPAPAPPPPAAAAAIGERS